MCCNIIMILIKLCALVGSNCDNSIINHVLENVKFINAQSAKQVYQFKNIKERLYKTIVLYNCVLSDDGSVRPETCRTWCIVIL